MKSHPAFDAFMGGLVALAKAEGLLQDPYGRYGPAPTKGDWCACMERYFVGVPKPVVEKFCNEFWLVLRRRMN